MTDISEFNVGNPIIGFGIKQKDSRIRLTEGETVIIKKNIGSFWKRKYIRKALTLKDGIVNVQVLGDI